MAMMMEPPTGSPSTIEMALAASRISTRGLAKKPRKASRAAKRDSAARLLGPWRRSRCFASAEVSPAGAALSRSSRFRNGISQKRSRVLFGVFMGRLGLGCTASANCRGTGSLAAAGSLTCSHGRVHGRFCTLRLRSIRLFQGRSVVQIGKPATGQRIATGSDQEIQDMPLVNLVIALIVVGVALWLINTYIPMASSIKTILNIVVVVAVAIWVLQAVGMWGRITSYKLGI